MDVSGELMENNPTKTSALSELGGVGWGHGKYWDRSSLSVRLAAVRHQRG